jgi:hypothetical protein
VLLGGLATGLSSGCTHYHYYGQQQAPMLYTTPGATATVPGACDPVVIQSGTPVGALVPEKSAPVLVTEAPRGSLCEVPGTSTAVVVGNGQRQVVASTPVTSSGRPRFAWRRPDPESLATTRIDGQPTSGSAIR